MTSQKDASEFRLGPALGFLQRLWRLDHALERLSSQMEKRLGITAQQRLLIRCVGNYPGITSGQLAAVLHVDPGTVSSTVGRLESKDLVERRKDPLDSRRVVLGLTRLGRQLDVPSEGTVEAAVNELFETISPAERETAISVYERFTAILEAKVAVGPGG